MALVPFDDRDGVIWMDGAMVPWRDAKLQTRCGMGACQGRICGTAAALYFGWDAALPRPPFSPAQIATLIEAAPESTTSVD